VFDPGLGQVRAGFFFSRYGFTVLITEDRRVFPRERETIPSSRAKTNSARKSRAGLAGLIAGDGLKSRQRGLKTG
jgi:hypothetical protein